jgi:hypothetical protein
MKRRHFLGATSAGLAGVILPQLVRGVTPCSPPTVAVMGGREAATTCPQPPPGPAPAWFLGMADGTWTTVAGATGSRIQDCLPNPVPTNPAGQVSGSPAGITAAWTGGAVDQTRGEYILCANGGHADYSGNEAYAIALRDAAPAWRRLSDPTPNAQITFDDNTGSQGAVNADGRCRAMHSTFECYADGQVWFGLQNAYASPAGGLSKSIWAYNRDSLGAATTPLPWTASNLGPWAYCGPVPTSYDGSVLKFGVAVFDRINHNIWALAGASANYSVYWSIPTQGSNIGKATAYAANQKFGSWGGWAAVAYDLRILVACDLQLNAITVLDLNNPGSSSAWSVVSNVSGSGYFESGSGGVYIHANNAIACGNPVNDGAAIAVLQIPTKVSGNQRVYDASGKWVWRTIPAPSGFTMSVAGGNSDAFSKWNIIEDMGNGQSAIVILTDITAPLYVYKVPASGI